MSLGTLVFSYPTSHRELASQAEITQTQAMGSLPGEEARAKCPVLSEQVANIAANNKQASPPPSRKTVRE